MSDIVKINIPTGDILPDKKLWTNRFEIRSESSNRVYIIAQHIEKQHWGCSCPGWKIHRKCKHLAAIGLAPYEQPQIVEVNYA